MSIENTRKKKRKRPVTGGTVRRMRKVKEKRPPFIISFSECGFCKEGSDNLRGTFFQDEQENLAAHQFCLLFSCGLPQSGSDNDGFEGFLFKDIRKEMRRASKIQCVFCQNYGASSGCAVKSCGGTYHYKCGLENDIQFDFHGTFNTYCSAHRSFQDMSYILNGSRTPVCPICLDDIDVSMSVLKMPCCRNVFSHKACIQLQAISSGYFFKCPTCKNEKIFKREMAKYGIYIPLRDATWEEDNAYSDLLQQYKNCDIPSCKCPMGKDYEEETGEWELIRCYHCGQGAVHACCLGKLSIPKYRYVCRDCNDATGVLKQSTFLAGNCQEQTLGQKKMIEDRLANGDPLVTECMRNAIWKRFNITPCRVELMRLPPSLLRLLEQAKNALANETEVDSSKGCQQSDIDVAEKCSSKSDSLSPTYEPVTLSESSEIECVQNEEVSDLIGTSPNSHVQLLSTSEATDITQCCQIEIDVNLEQSTDPMGIPLSSPSLLSPTYEPTTPFESSKIECVQNEEISDLIGTSSNSHMQLLSTSETTNIPKCCKIEIDVDLEQSTDSMGTPFSNLSLLSPISKVMIVERSPETPNCKDSLAVDACLDNFSTPLSVSKAITVATSDSPISLPTYNGTLFSANLETEHDENANRISLGLMEKSSCDPDPPLPLASTYTDVSIHFTKDVITETTQSIDTNLNLPMLSPTSKEMTVIKQVYPEDVPMEIVHLTDTDISYDNPTSLPLAETTEILPSLSPETTLSTFQATSVEAGPKEIHEVVYVKSIDPQDKSFVSTTPRLSKSSQPTRVATLSARSKITYYMNATKSTSLYTNNEKNRIRRKRRKRLDKHSNNTALDSWLRKDDFFSCHDNGGSRSIPAALTETLINSKFPRLVLSKCL